MSRIKFISLICLINLSLAWTEVKCVWWLFFPLSLVFCSHLHPLPWSLLPLTLKDWQIISAQRGMSCCSPSERWGSSIPVHPDCQSTHIHTVIQPFCFCTSLSWFVAVKMNTKLLLPSQTGFLCFLAQRMILENDSTCFMQCYLVSKHQVTLASFQQQPCNVCVAPLRCKHEGCSSLTVLDVGVCPAAQQQTDHNNAAVSHCQVQSCLARLWWERIKDREFIKPLLPLDETSPDLIFC